MDLIMIGYTIIIFLISPPGKQFFAINKTLKIFISSPTLTSG
jgi:hypothetical protein